MKQRLLSLRHGFLKFLRDPAWQGIQGLYFVVPIAIAIIGFIVVLARKHVAAILAAVWAWLTSTATLSVWHLVLGAAVLFAAPVLARRILRHRIAPRISKQPAARARNEKHLEEAWGVLWPWPAMGIGWYERALPVCPKHGLTMRIEEPATSEGFYMFVCRGDEGEPEHTIVGPDQRQLGGFSLRSDVEDRISGMLRREQKGA
jgi:hypothetical protein